MTKIQQNKEEKKEDPGKRNRGSKGLETDKSVVHGGTHMFLELAEKGLEEAGRVRSKSWRTVDSPLKHGDAIERS